MIYDTEKWQDAVDTYIDKVQDALSDYEDQMETIAKKTVGTNLTQIKNKTKAVTKANEELTDKITDPKNGTIKALKDEMISVSDLTGKYANLRQTIKDVVTQYEDLLKKIDTKVKTTSESEDDKDGSNGGNNSGDGNSGGGNSNGGNSSGGTSGKDGVISTGESVTVKSSATHFSTGERMKSFVPGGTYTVMQISGGTVLIGRNGVATGWVNKKDLENFDTGGYTGAWGSYGKLAMLHEKELVLNKQDTENLLMSVEVLNSILEAIDLQSASAQIGGLLSSPAYMGDAAQTIEQNVKIEASFPGVQDRNEIEEAFNNLINKASQYANRK